MQRRDDRKRNKSDGICLKIVGFITAKLMSGRGRHNRVVKFRSNEIPNPTQVRGDDSGRYDIRIQFKQTEESTKNGNFRAKLQKLGTEENTEKETPIPLFNGKGSTIKITASDDQSWMQPVNRSVDMKPKHQKPSRPLLTVDPNINEKTDAFLRSRMERMRREYFLETDK